MKLNRVLFSVAVSISVLGLGFSGCSQSANTEVDARESTTATQASAEQNQAQTTTPGQNSNRRLDVPYVPTPTSVVAEMLRIANVGPKDKLYDLGSGDGRIVITAAQKFGTRGVGIDIDPQRVQEANQNAQQAGVTNLVEFRQQDLFETDFSDATVVTLYLLPNINLKLKPKLLSELKPGTRIVSHAFDMGDWKPEKVVEVDGRTVYYWVVPEKNATNPR